MVFSICNEVRAVKNVFDNIYMLVDRLFKGNPWDMIAAGVAIEIAVLILAFGPNGVFVE